MQLLCIMLVATAAIFALCSPQQRRQLHQYARLLAVLLLITSIVAALYNVLL